MLSNFIDLNLKQVPGGEHGFQKTETTGLYFSESNSDSFEDNYPTDQYDLREYHPGGYHMHIRQCMKSEKLQLAA